MKETFCHRVLAIFIIIFFIFFFKFPLSSQCRLNKSQWEVVWSDEFLTPNLDLNKWDTDFNDGPNREAYLLVG